jgi:purine-binding chemotaxis protein CheW
VSLYVWLEAGGERYALPVEQVQEIEPLRELTPLPRAPRETLGLVNIRGRIVPVLDLAQLLGTEGAAKPSRLVVATVSGSCVAFAVDEVTSVAPLRDLQPDAGGMFVGTSQTSGALMGVIDAGRILASVNQGAQP